MNLRCEVVPFEPWECLRHDALIARYRDYLATKLDLGTVELVQGYWDWAREQFEDEVTRGWVIWCPECNQEVHSLHQLLQRGGMLFVTPTTGELVLFCPKGHEVQLYNVARPGLKFRAVEIDVVLADSIGQSFPDCFDPNPSVDDEVPAEIEFVAPDELDLSRFQHSDAGDTSVCAGGEA